MSAYSKKETEETEDTYGGVFGDLSALASDDSGEINSFASDVINREVSAGKASDLFSALGRKLDEGWRKVRHRGDADKIKLDRLNRQEVQNAKLLESVDKGDFQRIFKNPSMRRVLEADVRNQAEMIVNRAIKDARDLPKKTVAQAQSSLKKIQQELADAEQHLAKTQAAHQAATNTNKDIARREMDKARQYRDKVQEQVDASRENLQNVLNQYGTPEAMSNANNIALAMANKKDKLILGVENQIWSHAKRGNLVDDTAEFTIRSKGEYAIDGYQIKIPDIKLNRAGFQGKVDEIKLQQQPALSKEIDEIQKRVDARTVAKAGQVGKDAQGRVWKFNGVKWILLGSAALYGYNNLDKLPDIYKSFTNNNTEVDIGSGSSDSTVPTTTSPDGGFDAHDTPASTIDRFNPGGQSQQAPKPYGQDAWDRLKTPPPTQRRRFDSGSDDGWWNAPETSKPTYDDMGYIGGADESWTRTAQKVSPDELDDAGLSDYGAEQLLAAQNFLSYYGLGTDKQPGEQIIPSLLMGNFDGMSFEEYQRTHSEEEVRHAMKRFHQGLSMFSTEMTKLANNLEVFYQERQRRIEAQKSQPVQESNGQPERTE